MDEVNRSTNDEEVKIGEENNYVDLRADNSLTTAENISSLEVANKSISTGRNRTDRKRTGKSGR